MSENKKSEKLVERERAETVCDHADLHRSYLTKPARAAAALKWAKPSRGRLDKQRRRSPAMLPLVSA